jgi:hypothetical protein
MIYLFVEGLDDERFFQSVYRDYFNDEKCIIIKYAKKGKPEINNKIQSILSICRKMSSSDYLFVHDSDGKGIEDRINECFLEYNSKLDTKKIFIVKHEIESWYYAGLSEEYSKQLKLKKYYLNTDNLTKEDFINKLPNKSQKDTIMKMILSKYSLELALSRNESLRIFNTYIEKNLM